MKLLSLHFDGMVTVPDGKDNGSAEARQALRDSSFHASDGWDIRRETGGYSLHREGMPRRVFIDEMGNSYTLEEQAEPETSDFSEMVSTAMFPAPEPKRRRRK